MVPAIAFVSFTSRLLYFSSMVLTINTSLFGALISADSGLWLSVYLSREPKLFESELLESLLIYLRYFTYYESIWA